MTSCISCQEMKVKCWTEVTKETPRRSIKWKMRDDVMSWDGTESVPRFYMFGEDSASAYVLCH